MPTPGRHLKHSIAPRLLGRWLRCFPRIVPTYRGEDCSSFFVLLIQTSMLSSGRRSFWRIFIQLLNTSSKVVNRRSMCLDKNCVTLWRMREDKFFLVLWMRIQASSWKTWAHFLSGAGCIQWRIRSHQLIELLYLLMTPLTNASLTLLDATLTRLHLRQTRAWVLCIVTCKGSWVLNSMFQILWGATLIHQARDPSI